MNLNKLLLTPVILILFVTSFSQIIKERLPDNTLIIEVEGVEYRALPPTKMREVVLKLERLKVLETDYITLETSFTEYRHKTEEARLKAEELKQAELAKAAESGKFWEGEYLKEQKLRENYEHILKGCTGKVVIVRFCFR